MPDLTTTSAMPSINSSLTLQANLFHEFQPMGGVKTRLAEAEGLPCAKSVAPGNRTSVSRTNEVATRQNRRFFTGYFYQTRTLAASENPLDAALTQKIGPRKLVNLGEIYCFRLLFRDALQIRQTSLKVFPNHGVHAGKNHHHLRHQSAGAIHHPSHSRRSSPSRRNRKLRRIVPFKRLQKI